MGRLHALVPDLEEFLGGAKPGRVPAPTQTLIGLRDREARLAMCTAADEKYFRRPHFGVDRIRTSGRPYAAFVP